MGWPLNDICMTIEEIEAFLGEVFPQAFPPDRPRPFSVADLGRGEAVVRLAAGEEHLRPGGTVSGPALMTLADLAMYVVVLGHIGPVALAVTTSLGINFLRKPPPGPLLGRARLLKLGRNLAVGDVFLAAETEPDTAVAHASVTYSIPPSR